MNHAKHSYLMVGLVAVGAVLFLTGNAGGLLFLAWPLACMAMMVWMMWGMGGMGRSAPGPADHTHTHDDGLPHSHK
jgi:hypothetical protein